MSALARMQREFLAELVARDGPREAGIEVYRRNLLAARHDALAAAYPVTRRLVGEAFFRAAAEGFALAEPSRSGDLHLYGTGFGAFLAGYAPSAGLAYLPDVARLEWAVHESRHAADGVALDFAALGGLAPAALDGMRLRLHPAARLAASAFPVLAIWEANQPGRDGTPDRDTGPDRVLVRRMDYEVAPVLASDAEWALLEAFARGATLGEAADALEAASGALAPALARLAALGAMGGFEVGST